MKLSEVKAQVAQDEEGVPIPIKKKNGDPYLAADNKTPVTMTVLGSESKAVRKAEARQTRRVWRGQQQDIDEDTLLANRAERCAAAVVGWQGIEDDHDKPIPCTPENVKTLLMAAPHILDQVQRAVDGGARFFASASAAS